MSDYGEFCYEQRLHKQRERVRWREKRLAALRKNAPPMGLEFLPRDGGIVARIWHRDRPTIRVDWYLSTGRCLTVQGGTHSLYVRDLAAVAVLLTELAK